MAGSLATVLVGLLTVWSAAAVVRGLADVAHRDSPVGYHNVTQWQLTSGPVTDLRRFLEAAAQVVPEGHTVVFSSHPSPAGGAAIRLAWAAYLMPRHRVVAPPPPAADDAGYWIAYRTSPDRPGLEALLELEDGAVYRCQP